MKGNREEYWIDYVLKTSVEKTEKLLIEETAYLKVMVSLLHGKGSAGEKFKGGWEK